MTSLLISSIILVLLLGAALRGYRRGFVLTIVDFCGFVLATFIASTVYTKVAAGFERFIPQPQGLQNLTAFVFAWLLVAGLWLLATHAYKFRKLFLSRSASSPLSQIGGGAVSFVQAAVITTLGLIVLLALPVSGQFKSVLESAFGAKQMIAIGSRYQQSVNGLVGDLSETLNFITVKPQSSEAISLGFTTTAVRPDPVTEEAMIELVNRERIKHGLEPVSLDIIITGVARKHSSDMFARGYFSHVTPEGLDPFDRMRLGGIHFGAAGENLALAPTLSLAHNGLMNSPGHRANILEPSFRRVGVGVIDGGIYGKMFTQNFTD